MKLFADEGLAASPASSTQSMMLFSSFLDLAHMEDTSSRCTSGICPQFIDCVDDIIVTRY